MAHRATLASLMRHPRQRRGQSLVEFALIIPVLLFTILMLLELARVIQSYATIQHAAQEGGRYAATGQCDLSVTTCDSGTSGVLDSIYAVTERNTAGLIVDSAASAPGDPGYMRVTVLGTDTSGEIYPFERPGDPGAKTFVTVTYSMPVIAPIVNTFLPAVTLNAEVVVSNETQGGTLSQEGVLPPSLNLTGFQEEVDDGIDDQWEFDNFGSPGAYDADDDPDGDGCDNLCEYTNGTDPNDPDTDDGGVPDGWEIDNGFDPLDGTDDDVDSDGDGFTNEEEYADDTDPNDPADFPGRMNVTLVLNPNYVDVGEPSPIVLDVVVTDNLGDPLLPILGASNFSWTLSPDPGSTPILTSIDSGTGTYTFELYAGAFASGVYDITVLVDDGTSTEEATSAFSVGESVSATLLITPSSVEEGTTATLTLDVHVDEEGPAPKTGLVNGNFTWPTLPAGTSVSGFSEVGGGDYTFTLNGVDTLSVSAAHDVSVTVNDGSANDTANASFAVTAAPDTLSATMNITPSSSPEGTSTLTVDLYVEEEGPSPVTTLGSGDFTFDVASAGGASIVGGSFVNVGSGNYQFQLSVSGVTEGTGYSVSVQVSDGAAVANTSDTFDITAAASSCVVEGETSFTSNFSNDELRWDMDNTGDEDVRLRRADITWPDGSSQPDVLIRIRWREPNTGSYVDIWTSPDQGSSPSSFGDGTSLAWSGGTSTTRVLHTATDARISFEFQNANVDNSGFSYTVTLYFEVVSDTSITCSISDSHTF